MATSTSVISGASAGGHGSFVGAESTARALRPVAALPAVAAQLAERARGGAVDDRLHVVIRPIRLAIGVAAHGLAAGVLGRVPAAVREIETADERDRIVDDDDLLMVRRAERMLVVEAEVQAPVRAPVELVERQPFAVHREHHREIPRQHVHLQIAAALDDFVQEIAELLGIAVVCALRARAGCGCRCPTRG